MFQEKLQCKSQGLYSNLYLHMDQLLTLKDHLQGFQIPHLDLIPLLRLLRHCSHPLLLCCCPALLHHLQSSLQSIDFQQLRHDSARLIVDLVMDTSPHHHTSTQLASFTCNISSGLSQLNFVHILHSHQFHTLSLQPHSINLLLVSHSRQH